MSAKTEPVLHNQHVTPSEWRRLTRIATAVALMTSPGVLLWLHNHDGLSWLWALLATLGLVIAFRGLVDIMMRKLVPWPHLFDAEQTFKEEDAVNRRRAWFWGSIYRRLITIGGAVAVITTVVMVVHNVHSSGKVTWLSTLKSLTIAILPKLPTLMVGFGFQMVIFFFINLIIMFGPLLFFGIRQIQVFEPGDSDWGVKLDDVRGQKEAVEEVRRIVNLWQSSAQFKASGGTPERGLMFLGPPGVGKTMLAKAIATGFNAPFLSIPGSGFQQAFMGTDVLIVRYMAHKARKMARKWGGQCIIFIDEIDAVGMRRASLGAGASMTPAVPALAPQSFQEFAFFGPKGSLTASGDLYLETPEWRDRIFALRAPERKSIYPAVYTHALDAIQRIISPGMMGGMGSMALNQLLVVMDGIGQARGVKKVLVTKLNTWLDASYILPRRIGKLRLRLKPARPADEQIYFIGATNVPLDALDPALTRPGRMGRHVWFRTPNKKDRLDIFDLYVSRVAHDESLDTPEAREELAKITPGYSPAQIQQCCNLALTYAQAEGRPVFNRDDIVKAMTSLESGMADPVVYSDEESRAIAIHESGHAATAHVFLKGIESTRLSILKRGGSLGHHQALPQEERFSSWRDEEMANIVWALGAMAAEHVFYNQNSTGVGGDVQSATGRAAWMVGSCAMAPVEVPFPEGVNFDSPEAEDEARKKIAERFQKIGLTIMRRAGGGGPFEADPISGVLSDRDKRLLAAEILGQAYVAAWTLIVANKTKVENLAGELIAKREIYGNDLMALLEGSDFKQVPFDPLDDAAWPIL